MDRATDIVQPIENQRATQLRLVVAASIAQLWLEALVTAMMCAAGASRPAPSSRARLSGRGTEVEGALRRAMPKYAETGTATLPSA